MSRSLWKPIPLYNKKKNQPIQKNFIFKRGLPITSEWVNETVHIYNGTRFFEVSITNKMLGLKFGEFSPSRKIPLHKKKKNIKKKK